MGSISSDPFAEVQPQSAYHFVHQMAVEIFELKKFPLKRAGFERWLSRVAALDATSVPRSRSNFRKKSSVFKLIVNRDIW